VENDSGNCRLGFWLLLLVIDYLRHFLPPILRVRILLGRTWAVAIHGATAASSKILRQYIHQNVILVSFASNENGDSFMLGDQEWYSIQIFIETLHHDPVVKLLKFLSKIIHHRSFAMKIFLLIKKEKIDIYVRTLARYHWFDRIKQLHFYTVRVARDKLPML